MQGVEHEHFLRLDVYLKLWPNNSPIHPTGMPGAVMKIAQDTVVALDFTLTDDTGEIIDSSEGEALSYLHGHGELVVGLERALTGRAVGDKLEVTVSAEDGYGEVQEGLEITVERAELPDDLEPEVGMELACDGPDDETLTMWIVEVADSFVRLDGNHPLAGQTLHFKVEVVSIRPASPLELDHGHVHADDDDSDPIDSGAYTH
jgi:FKBP-type peptidyl-prolyl cis-trans isomerase SlyD